MDYSYLFNVFGWSFKKIILFILKKENINNISSIVEFIFKENCKEFVLVFLVYCFIDLCVWVFVCWFDWMVFVV